MSEKSWLFNAVNGDRAYNAEDIGAFIAPFFSGGVFMDSSTNLQVTADGSGMAVTVQPGYALVKTTDGKLHMYRVDADLALTIATADGVNNRIDRVVVRLDTANRLISAQIKQGAYAASPTAPDVEQDADYWELALADVSVPAGATAISQAAVTDQRLNTGICGVVAATTGDQAAFDAWFASIKGQLTTDAAGNLQEQFIKAQLFAEAIQGTTQTVTTDADGNITEIDHKNSNGVAVRTDVYTYAVDLVTEVRTLNSGETVTIKNHLDTWTKEVI